MSVRAALAVAPLLAAAALGESAARAESATPFSQLRTVTETAALERATPAVIPAAEKAGGVFVAKHRQSYYTAVVLSPDPARAASFEKTGNLVVDPAGPAPTACFPHSSDYMSFSEAAGGGEVMDVITEKVVKEGDHATLTTRRVWVDTRTRGSRIKQETAMTYDLVSRGPRGAEVYAARSPGFLQILVVGPEGAVRFESLGAGRMTDCRFLSAKVPMASGGGTVVLIGDVRFDGPSPDETEPDDTVAANTKEKPAHVRTLAMAVSVSQTTSEADAAISVSYSWHGKGRPFFDPNRVNMNARRHRGPIMDLE